MGDLTVYTDPRSPGAPQPGDVVTVAKTHPPHVETGATLDGRTIMLAYCEKGKTRGAYKWVVDDGTGWELVYAVRRPTEAEIAQWALGCPS